MVEEMLHAAPYKYNKGFKSRAQMNKTLHFYKTMLSYITTIN